MNTEKSVWKYSIDIDCMQGVLIPQGAEIIHVGRDPSNGGVSFWAEVDPSAPQIMRHFFLVGTGWSMPAADRHHGTVVLAPYVWHLYEREKGSAKAA